MHRSPLGAQTDLHKNATTNGSVVLAQFTRQDQPSGYVGRILIYRNVKQRRNPSKGSGYFYEGPYSVGSDFNAAAENG